MPYTEQELQNNLHFQSLKERDEIKYEERFQKDYNTFVENFKLVLTEEEESESDTEEGN